MFSKTLGNVEIDKLDEEVVYAKCVEIFKSYTENTQTEELTYEQPILFNEIYKQLTEYKAISVNVREHIDLKRLAAYMSPELNKYIVNVTKDIAKQKCLYKYVLLHELGHIYFNHSSLTTYYELIAVIRKCLEDKEIRDYNKGTLITLFYKFANIAADFEINSKLFSPTEFVNLCKLLAYSPSHNIIIGCHPDFMDFPRQLTAQEYIALLLKDIKSKNPKEILKELGDILKKIQGKEGKTSGVNINITNTMGLSRNDNQAVVKMSREEALDFFEGGGNSKVKVTKDETLNIKSDKDIAKLVSQLFSKEYLLELHKNNLYNYNRGKINYILPRYKSSIKSTITDMFFVIDVSPSMNLNFVKKFIKETKNKLAGLNYNLMCFASDITFNGKLSQIKDTFPVSVGTNIAIPLDKLLSMGISKTTKVILISDFDSPSHIYIEYLNKIPNILCIEAILGSVSYYPKEYIRSDIQRIQLKIRN